MWLSAQVYFIEHLGNRIKKLFLLAPILVAAHLQGQTLTITAQIDSLQKLLQKPHVSDNADVYIQLSLLYQGINPEQAYQYAIRAYDLAEKNRQRQTKMLAILQMGEYYLSQSKPKEAFPLFQQAYMLANAARDTMYAGVAKGKMGVALYLELQYVSAIQYLTEAIKLIRPYRQANIYRANFLNTLSYIFSKKGAYTTAIEYARRALELRQKIDPSGEMTARSFTTLGEFYLLQGNLRKAMEYFNSALQINTKNNNKRGIAIMLTHIGNVYLQEGNYKSALNNLLAALEIKRNIHAPPRELALTQLLLAKTHLAENHPEKAHAYLNQAIEAFSLVNDQYNMSLAYGEKAKYHTALKQFDKALKAHERSINLARRADHLPLVISGYEALAETYLQMNDAKNFFKYYKLYRSGKDSLDKELKSLEVILLQEELDRRKQESQRLAAENKALQAQRQREKVQIQRNFSLFVAALAAGIAFVIGWLLKARLKDKKRLEEQNELILRQNAELERQKQELQELIGTKDKLFSIVAHDIRTPLAGLSSMIELLQKRQISLDEEGVQEALRQIGKSLANVHQLLNNLLDWARLQTGAFTFAPVNIPLIGVIRRIMELFEPQAEGKNITIIGETDPELVVFADKNMLEFVLRNVVSNAIKFTFPGKKIILRTQKEDNAVIISVIDQGVGLSEDEAEKIFDLPASKLGTKGERGAGIALSICAEFMKKHGGKIWATPNPEGGSIFHIKFPAAALF